MEVERRGAADLQRAMENQQNAITDKVRGVSQENLFRDTELTINDLFTDADLIPTSAEVEYELNRLMAKSAELGVDVALAQFENVGLAFDWALVNADARDWANKYTGRLIKDINKTTARRTRASLVQWIDSGAPLQGLIDDLAPIFGRTRAELIASTEATKAYARGNRLAYRNSGVVDEMEWRTAVDEMVCPICGPLHGQRANLDSGFSVAVTPPAHPRCRCWIVAVVE